MKARTMLPLLTVPLFSHISRIPCQDRKDDDVEEQHSENVVERETVLTLSRRADGNSLSFMHMTRVVFNAQQK